jgi:hypothetical protein
MQQSDSRLKVAKYDPLTLECVMCGERFSASSKSAEQLTAEIEGHMSLHPAQRKAA